MGRMVLLCLDWASGDLPVLTQDEGSQGGHNDTQAA
jgi:hypothetical protein